MENQNDINNETLDFDFKPAEENHSIIKVVGVGGGGSNAVQHMYEAGIQDVSFLIINTDKQALRGSSIPNKLLISEKGLGAGAKPEVAREYAEQHKDLIHQALNDGTEMVFITAGMGGGTGTGAAPVVAEIAHNMNILTVGIVTIPFRFEGKKKIEMALAGVRSIEKWCDALLVINNDRLIDVYPDLDFGNAFGKADDTLTTAAKSISDIITIQGYINLDFADVSTTLRNGGVALISTGTANGEKRLSKSIDAAIKSPLLQDNKITDAKHLLFELCFSHKNPLSMAEVDEMNHFVDSLNSEIDVIWGAMYDDSLGDDVRIILLASGFSMNPHTGEVYKMQDKVKQMQSSLRTSIVDFQQYLGEFENYPEAQSLFDNALHAATEKANSITLDDNVEEEVAKLGDALAQARKKKQDAIDAEIMTKQKKAEEEKQKILDQIEELKKKLTEAETPIATAPSPQPKAEESPKSVEVTPKEPVFEEPKVEEPKAPEIPITPKAAPTPRPVKDVNDGLDEIRRFYGEETANQMLLSDTRKAYYVLDDKELTNEELIKRLEHLPAYNRKLEDLGQLQAVSRQPAQPKVIGHHPEAPDGTIKF